MDWSEILQAGKREQRPAEQVFQEELQKTVLTALSREEIFQRIIFQGGTALRLFYANPRFSEDLDFVLKEGVSEVDLSEQTPRIENFTKDTFPFLDSVNLETQKNTPELQRLILKTNSDLLPRTIRLHLELAFVPSYLNWPRILDFSPFYPAIQVEKEAEILADKLTALICRPYLKGRDIWDIYYLVIEKSLQPSWGLVGKKIRDYQVNGKNLEEKHANTAREIERRGKSVLEAELSRFLPKPQYDRYHDHFQDIIRQVNGILKKADFSQIRDGGSHESR